MAGIGWGFCASFAQPASARREARRRRVRRAAANLIPRVAQGSVGRRRGAEGTLRGLPGAGVGGTRFASTAFLLASGAGGEGPRCGSPRRGGMRWERRRAGMRGAEARPGWVGAFQRQWGMGSRRPSPDRAGGGESSLRRARRLCAGADTRSPTFSRAFPCGRPLTAQLSVSPAPARGPWEGVSLTGRLFRR